jgi:hypothetical protein
VYFPSFWEEDSIILSYHPWYTTVSIVVHVPDMVVLKRWVVRPMWLKRWVVRPVVEEVGCQARGRRSGLSGP